MVVHGIPSDDVVLRDGDIISIDCGAIVDGWHGDAAFTAPVGTVAPDLLRLIEVAERSLDAAIDAMVAGNRLGDIGHAVETVATEAGMSIVEGFTGHGIGRAMHEPPNVPNQGVAGTGVKLKVGNVLAVEPMIVLGDAEVELLDDDWSVVTASGDWAAHAEHTIAITDDGPQVLTRPEPSAPSGRCSAPAGPGELDGDRRVIAEIVAVRIDEHVGLPASFVDGEDDVATVAPPDLVDRPGRVARRDGAHVDEPDVGHELLPDRTVDRLHDVAGLGVQVGVAGHDDRPPVGVLVDVGGQSVEVLGDHAAVGGRAAGFGVQVVDVDLDAVGHRDRGAREPFMARQSPAPPSEVSMPP